MGDSKKSATAVGLCAVVLWSMMLGFVRLTTQSFGPALGSALIYSCAAVFTYIGYRPTPLRRLPLKYVLFSGGLFVFYETAITVSIGLAASSEQTLELSLVNYLCRRSCLGGVFGVFKQVFARLRCDCLFHGGCCCGLVDNLPLRGRARSCGGARLASVFRPCGRCRLHCFGLCLLGAWHAQGRHGENGHRVLCRSFAFGCGEHHHSRRKSHAAVLVWHFRRSGRLPH